MDDLESVYRHGDNGIFNDLQNSYLNNADWGSTFDLDPDITPIESVSGAGKEEQCDCGCPSASLAHYMIDLLEGMSKDQTDKVLSILDAWRHTGKTEIAGSDEKTDYAIKTSREIEQDFTSAHAGMDKNEVIEVDIQLDDAELEKIMKGFDFVAQKKSKLDKNAQKKQKQEEDPDYEDVTFELDFDIEEDLDKVPDKRVDMI